MADGAVRARGLHEFVIDHIGQRIAAGELRTGSQILPEVIGSELGVSRTVVREALRDLQAKGMVLPRPKTGTRVLSVEDWNLLDEQVISWRVRTPARIDQLRELMDLRCGVELSAIRASCQRATERDLAELGRCCDAMEQGLLAADPTAFTDADINFHNALLKASGNLVFRQFAAPFAAVLRARDDLHLLPDQVDMAVVVVHRDIVAAIAAQDPQRATVAADQLIQHARIEMGLA